MLNVDAAVGECVWACVQRCESVHAQPRCGDLGAGHRQEQRHAVQQAGDQLQRHRSTDSGLLARRAR